MGVGAGGNGAGGEGWTSGGREGGRSKGLGGEERGRGQGDGRGRRRHHHQLGVRIRDFRFGTKSSGSQHTSSQYIPHLPYPPPSSHLPYPITLSPSNPPPRCAAAYPEDSRPVLPELLPLWFDHLWDNIPTVREDTAAALARAVAAYGGEVTEKVVDTLRCDICQGSFLVGQAAGG